MKRQRSKEIRQRGENGNVISYDKSETVDKEICGVEKRRKVQMKDT